MFHLKKIVRRLAALIHQQLRIVISKKKVGVLNKVLLLSSIIATNIIIYASTIFDIIVQYIFKYSIINFIFPLSPFYFSHDHLTTITVTTLTINILIIITVITITTLTNTTLSPPHCHENNHHHYCTITTTNYLRHHILLFHIHSRLWSNSAF